MHDIDRTLTEFDSELDALEADEFEFGGEYESNNYEAELESPFDEVEEMELAAELLSLQSEEELDQFIGGNLFKRIKSGLKNIRALRPLANMARGMISKALPIIGGGIGSFIPGAGTVIGSAIGSAASKALETEFEGMDPEDQEFEMAKRLVRITTSAAQQAAAAGSDTDPEVAAKNALIAAAREQIPAIGSKVSGKPSARARGRGQGGRWIRHGRKIVLLDV